MAIELPKFVDAYTMRARIIPGLLTVLPAAISVYAWQPGGLLDWNSLGGLLTGFGGTVLLAFIARDLGKAAEDRLYAKWGGRPTELVMLHSGSVDPALRALRHAALRRLFPDVPVPTATEEEKDREAAIRRFTTLTGLVISRYRAMKDAFPLVFEENCNYGFRRNLYGLRPIGLTISAAAALVLGLQLYIRFLEHERVAGLPVVLEFLNITMFVVWTAWVRSEMVRRGATLYAERLLETLDSV